MDIHYKHNKRQIVDDTGKQYTWAEAQTAWENGVFSSCNLAFQTLYNLGGDMEAVEEHYIESEDKAKRRETQVEGGNA